MAHISIADILELSVPDRIRLAQAIWDTIAEVPEAIPVTAAQKALIDSRLEAYYEDPGAGSPWDDVKARITGGQ